MDSKGEDLEDSVGKNWRDQKKNGEAWSLRSCKPCGNAANWDGKSQSGSLSARGGPTPRPSPGLLGVGRREEPGGEFGVVLLDGLGEAFFHLGARGGRPLVEEIHGLLILAAENKLQRAREKGAHNVFQVEVPFGAGWQPFDVLGVSCRLSSRNSSSASLRIWVQNSGV